MLYVVDLQENKFSERVASLVYLHYLCSMKICTQCKVDKDNSEFYQWTSSTTGKIRTRSNCRACEYKRIGSVSNHRKKMYAWFDELKRTLSCSDCGMSFKDAPWVCDFHHRDPSTKLGSISMFVAHAGSMKLALEELPKCDPLCANCHRTRHHKELYEFRKVRT